MAAAIEGAAGLLGTLGAALPPRPAKSAAIKEEDKNSDVGSDSGDEGGREQDDIEFRRPPAFFALDGADGFPTCPLGALAAIHLELACTNGANGAGMGGLDSGIGSFNANSGDGTIELESVWSDSTSLWPMASNLPLQPLPPHPSTMHEPNRDLSLEESQPTGIHRTPRSTSGWRHEESGFAYTMPYSTAHRSQRSKLHRERDRNRHRERDKV